MQRDIFNSIKKDIKYEDTKKAITLKISGIENRGDKFKIIYVGSGIKMFASYNIDIKNNKKIPTRILINFVE